MDIFEAGDNYRDRQDAEPGMPMFYPQTPEPFDLVTYLIRLDEGDLDEDEMTGLFQHLVDTGLAWQLQGRIGRQARDMIDAGLIHLPERV